MSWIEPVATISTPEPSRMKERKKMREQGQGGLVAKFFSKAFRDTRHTTIGGERFSEDWKGPTAAAAELGCRRLAGNDFRRI